MSQELAAKSSPLNGPWTVVLKVALATYPFVILLAAWITRETFFNMSVREKTFTKEDSLRLEMRLMEKIASLPPPDWRARVMQLEKTVEENKGRLIRIEAIAADIKQNTAQ